jgi:heme oxygenase
MNEPCVNSVRAFLKAATADSHNRIESRYGAIFDVDESGYGRFLSATARAVLSLERALTEGAAEIPIADWEARSRTPALTADLADLGLDVPQPSAAPPGRDESFRFGVLYVLEGSRHGTRQLARAALTSRSPVVRSATRYLRQGEAQRLWPSFVAQLEASPAVRSDPAGAARGATAAFSAFDDALDWLGDAASPDMTVAVAR